MTEEQIKLGNKAIAEFMGYVYFERGVHMDVGDYYKDWQDVDVYSKVPIEVDDYPKDEQKYFKDLPNPDFGNKDSKRWRSDLEKLSWATLNWDNYITDLKYHESWDWLMSVCKKIASEDEVIQYKIGELISGCEFDILRVFKAIVEHIKRKNDNKKNN